MRLLKEGERERDTSYLRNPRIQGCLVGKDQLELFPYGLSAKNNCYLVGKKDYNTQFGKKDYITQCFNYHILWFVKKKQ
jgi:hypothetical protein